MCMTATTPPQGPVFEYNYKLISTNVQNDFIDMPLVYSMYNKTNSSLHLPIDNVMEIAASPNR